jgi:hypothetical protein
MSEDGRIGRGADQFPLRLPDGMRDRLKKAAAANKRSMNAEIVSRLERFDSLGGEVDALNLMSEQIDEVCGEDPDLLRDKFGQVFGAVDEFGSADWARLQRDWANEVSRRLKGATDGAGRELGAEVRRLSKLLSELKFQMTLERANAIKLWDLEPHILEEAIASNEILSVMLDSGEISDRAIREALQSGFSYPAGPRRTEVLQKLVKLLGERRSIDRGLADAESVLTRLKDYVAGKKKAPAPK